MEHTKKHMPRIASANAVDALLTLLLSLLLKSMLLKHNMFIFLVVGWLVVLGLTAL